MHLCGLRHLRARVEHQRVPGVDEEEAGVVTEAVALARMVQEIKKAKDRRFEHFAHASFTLLNAQPLHKLRVRKVWRGLAAETFLPDMDINSPLPTLSLLATTS